MQAKGRTLDKVQALFPVGSIFVVTEQTSRPELIGQRRRVLKAQREELKVEIIDGGDGKPFWAVLPNRAGQVLELTDRSVRFRLPQNEAHTLCFEREDPRFRSPREGGTIECRQQARDACAEERESVLAFLAREDSPRRHAFRRSYIERGLPGLDRWMIGLALETLERTGLVERPGGWWRLTRRGWAGR
jgi:hypothetical protein